MKAAWKQKLVLLAGAIAAVGLIVLYVFEFRWFDRTIQFSQLVGWSLGVGAIIGILLGRYFSQNETDLTDKIRLFLFCFFPCVLFAPFVASWSNRVAFWQESRTEPVVFVQAQAYYASRSGPLKGEKIKPSGWAYFFYYRGKLRRIKSKEQWAIPAQMNRGDTLLLNMKRGLWGFDVVRFES
ncbi:MAG TPA: hypothetical protein PKA00_11920 [Saprospiraceae bacterium]|nr:hypothetical protein [Saprospiraceae bacterium]HMQ83612.1 hypothetical protein [Saprospiraceae bacterium]